MKKQQFKSLGLAVNIDVPATVKEFDENAKREGACLEEAINNVAYRGVLAEFRDTFLHGREADKEAGIVAVKGLEDVTGIARKLKKTGRKTDKGEDIEIFAETEAEYFDRVCTEKKVEASAYQKLADTICAAIKFDASARERKPIGPKKLAAKYKETASAILKGPHLQRFVADVKKALGKEWVSVKDEPKDIEALGWLVKEMVDYKEKQQLASFAS